MRLFDAYLFVDWSARNGPSPARPSADALWVAESGNDSGGTETYFRTRHACTEHLRERLLHHTRAGRRVLIGYDFPLGYPVGFAAVLEAGGESVPPPHPQTPTDQHAPWRRAWTLIASLVRDDDRNRSNRFEAACELNRRAGATAGPFWGCPHARETAELGARSPGFPHACGAGEELGRWRVTDRRLRGLQEAWKLYGTGSVGSQALLGIPRVLALREEPELAAASRVWPFETGFDAGPQGAPFVLHAEVWPGVVRHRLDASVSIRDQAQVRCLAQWARELDEREALAPLFGTPTGLTPVEAAGCVAEEGWILGA